MNLLRFRLCLAAGVAAAALPVRADDSAAAELKVLEARLQEQRAEAAAGRLTLYLDELHQLHARMTAAGDSTGAAAVQQEIDTATLDGKRLRAIAAGQADPPSKDEAGENEEAPDPSAIAAKRIDAIISRYTKAKQETTSTRPGATAGTPRQRILKIEKASRNRDYTYQEGGAYWAYEKTWAAWTIADMVPGEYEVILRYTAKKDAGGKALIRAAGQKLEVTISPSDSSKEQKLPAGTIKITEPGVDFRVENGGLAKDAKYLWNLESVVLQPVGQRP